MMAPAAPPTAAPMMAPVAVWSDCFPITPPATAPVPAPMTAPLVLLFMEAQLAAIGRITRTIASVRVCRDLGCMEYLLAGRGRREDFFASHVPGEKEPL